MKGLSPLPTIIREHINITQLVAKDANKIETEPIK
jgi:hypothetical protein